MFGDHCSPRPGCNRRSPNRAMVQLRKPPSIIIESPPQLSKSGAARPAQPGLPGSSRGSSKRSLDRLSAISKLHGTGRYRRIANGRSAVRSGSPRHTRPKRGATRRDDRIGSGSMHQQLCKLSVFRQVSCRQAPARQSQCAVRSSDAVNSSMRVANSDVANSMRARISCSICSTRGPAACAEWPDVLLR